MVGQLLQFRNLLPQTHLVDAAVRMATLQIPLRVVYANTKCWILFLYVVHMVHT
jgi:hypothetical protein